MNCPNCGEKITEKDLIQEVCPHCDIDLDSEDMEESDRFDLEEEDDDFEDKDYSDL